MFHSALLNPFDTSLYHLINGLAGHISVLATLMIFFANYDLEIYVVLFIIAWFVLPKKDIKHRHALIIAGLSGILALILNVVIANIWFRPRPFTVFPKGSFTQLVPHSSDASFPSDHASGSFGFAAASWGRNEKWISRTFTTIAILVMIARVYVGVHYPTDVLAGLVIGIIASRIMWRLARFIFPVSVWVAKLFHFGEGQDKNKAADTLH